MTGNEHGYRVCTAGSAHGPGSVRLFDASRDLPVGHCVPRLNLEQIIPDPTLKRCGSRPIQRRESDRRGSLERGEKRAFRNRTPLPHLARHSRGALRSNTMSAAGKRQAGQSAFRKLGREEA